jgi:hypothetical protein
MAKLFSYALIRGSCGVGRGFCGAPPNSSLSAAMTSAGSASATAISVAFEAAYHLP